VATPTTPGSAAPLSLPLTAEQRAAYQDLYNKYEAAIESTADVGLLTSLNASQSDVEAVLDKDAEYGLAANTALYQALLLQINTTNSNLKKLKIQIQAIASGISTFSEILAAIDKLLPLIPGV